MKQTGSPKYGYTNPKYYDLDNVQLNKQSTGASMDFNLGGSTFETLQMLSGLESQPFYKYVKSLRDMLNIKPSNARKETRISDL